MIIKLSKQLGNTIGELQEYKTFQEKSKVMEKNTKLKKLLKTITDKKVEIDKKLRTGKPVEADEKREVKDIEDTLKGNKTFMEFARAQEAYFKILNKINEAMTEGIKEVND